MDMIGRFSKDWKADWPKHFPKLVDAYNSMRLAITRYSPHYFMVWCQLCLPIDFYFLTIRGTQKHQCAEHYVTELQDQLWEAFKEVLIQSTSEVARQEQPYNRKANAILLEPGDLVLAKGLVGGVTVKWSTKLQEASLPTLWKTSRQDAHESTKIELFSLLQERGFISVWLCRPSRPGAPPLP